MVVDVRERTIEEIKGRLLMLNTPLVKISYLESALKIAGATFEVKRFIYSRLAELYEEGRMLERAAKSAYSLAGIEISLREKIEAYMKAAELYAKLGRIEDADEMFSRASHDSGGEQKSKVLLARKNIYLVSARGLDSLGKKASAMKFYEKLMNMKLDDLESKEVKFRLIEIYKALGKFREAKMIEGK